MLSDSFDQVLLQIRDRAEAHDASGEWPAHDLADLAALGAMRWAVPKSFGGDEIDPLELHQRYEQLAAASLTTALILSQRDSAVGMLVGGEEFPARAELLEALARNDAFTTIGIAQLTTSRQRGAPALQASADGDGFRLNGEIPWATGADHCDYICAGAVLDDGRQILFTLPIALPGVSVQPPLPLVALRASHTSSIVCENARIDPRQILVAPTSNALASRRKPLPIGQSFLAMGLCGAAIDLIARIDSPTGRSAYRDLRAQLDSLRREVISYCSSEAPLPADGNALRGRTIDLAVRATHAAVSLHKGSGLLLGHPAQRLAREALFLLVWSCPGPVVECTLERLIYSGSQP